MHDKNIYDIIFLNDNELGIDSGKTNERPAVIVCINAIEGGASVVPLTSNPRSHDPNNSQYQLSTGSFIDLSNEPVSIREEQLIYSRLSPNNISNRDIEELEYRFQFHCSE